METWNIHDMPGRAPPLPPVVVYVLVGRALHEGQLGLAAGLALAFATFLRTGEMLSAQYHHVAVFEGAGKIAFRSRRWESAEDIRKWSLSSAP